MTNEEILGMARSAGFEQVMRHADGSSTVLPTELFVSFYELVAIHTLATQNNRNEFVDFLLLKKEHSARIAAQSEVAELKKQLASSIDEQRRAVLAEREACRTECQTLADILRPHDIYGAELAESLAAGIAARGHKTPDAAPQNTVTQAAIRLLTALDKLDEGCNCPGFNGWQNGHGEDVGDEAQAAREALEAITGHKEKKA